MKQVKTSMCTTMCCSMMNMSMYMHSMCKTQHSALKENSNKHRINKVINRKLLYNYFRKCCLNDEVENMKFDDFYNYAKTELPKK